MLNRGRTLGTFRKGEITREEVLEMMSGGKELKELGAELEEFARADVGPDSSFEAGSAAEQAFAEGIQKEYKEIHH
jgi:hypothetical protein